VSALRRDIEVQHRAFSLDRFEPGLSNAFEGFDVHHGKHSFRTAGPGAASMDDEIVLELVQEP
jgi:hypothetical protein